MEERRWLFLFHNGQEGEPPIMVLKINKPSLIEASISAWEQFIQSHPDEWRQMQTCEQIIYVRIWR